MVSGIILVLDWLDFLDLKERAEFEDLPRVMLLRTGLVAFSLYLGPLRRWKYLHISLTLAPFWRKSKCLPFPHLHSERRCPASHDHAAHQAHTELLAYMVDSTHLAFQIPTTCRHCCSDTTGNRGEELTFLRAYMLAGVYRK